MARWYGSKGIVASVSRYSRSRREWLPLHISLMCGSYISFVTAFLVVNLGLGSVLAWALPTVAGSPLIARAVVRTVRMGGADPKVRRHVPVA